MNSKFLLRVIFFILTLGVNSAITAETAKPLSLHNILLQHSYQTLQITVKNDFLYINATINKRHAAAILDTGSSAINLMKGSAKKLKLATFNTPQNAGIGMHGKKTFQKSVLLKSITIGKVHLQNVTANIFQHVTPPNMPTLVVGRAFLKRHHAIIDLAHKKLYLSHKKLTHVAMKQINDMLLRQQSRAVPLLSLGAGGMTLPLQINCLPPALFLFDTGTGITLLSQAYAKTEHLNRHNKDTQIVTTKLILNPLNLSMQPQIALHGIAVQPVDLTLLRKYLYVQGIFGLADMIKAHAIIFLNEGVIYVRSH